MNCKHCGALLEENAVFCGACGMAVTSETEAPVEAEVPAQTVVEPAQTVVEPAQTVVEPAQSFFAPEPEAPKKSKAPIILAVVALIAVVAGVLGFVFWDDLFGNNIKEEEQLAYALTHYSEDDEMFTDKWLKKANSNVAADGSVNLEISEMLTASLGVSASDVTLKYDADYIPGDKMALVLDAFVGESEIASGEVYFDFKNSKLVVALPGLMEKPVEINIAEIDPSAAEMFSSMVTSMGGESTQKSAAAIEAVLKILYESLMDIPFTTETTALTANGVSEEMLCINVNLDAKTMTAFAKNFLEKVKTSAEVKTFFTNTVQDIAFLEGEDVYPSFVEMMDGLLESLDEVDTTDEETLAVKLWVDEEYDIQGAKLCMDDRNALFFGVAQSDANVGLEAYVTDEGVEVIALRGNGTAKNDLYDMDVELFVDGEAVLNVAVTDFKCADDAFKGKFTVTFKGDLADAWSDAVGGFLAAPTLVIECDVSETVMNYSVAVKLGESMQVFKLTANSSISDKAEVNIPADTTTDLSAFSTMDFATLIDRLEQAGIPVSDLVDMLGGGSLSL